METVCKTVTGRSDSGTVLSNIVAVEISSLKDFRFTKVNLQQQTEMNEQQPCNSQGKRHFGFVHRHLCLGGADWHENE